MLREKKQPKKEFRRAVRIELAKLRNEEKENILETRTKDTKMFHRLVRMFRERISFVISSEVTFLMLFH
jgi:hypothetical protein